MYMNFKRLKKNLGAKRLKNILHISERYGYIYVSNPKAGCSTIKLYLSKCEMCAPDYLPEDLHKRRFLPLKVIKNSTEIELKKVFNNNAFIFTFVRHPLNRAVSAYGEKILGNKPQKREILERLGENTDNIEREINFNDFVKVITSQKPKDGNPHWRPQFYNLYPNIIKYNFIGHLEKFDEEIDNIRSKLNLPNYSIPIQNVRPVRINRKKLLTPKNRFRLAKYYAKDFKAFAYTPKGIEWLGVISGQLPILKSL